MADLIACLCARFVLRSEDLFEQFGPPKVCPGVPQLATDLTGAAFAKALDFASWRLLQNELRRWSHGPNDTYGILEFYGPYDVITAVSLLE